MKSQKELQQIKVPETRWEGVTGDGTPEEKIEQTHSKDTAEHEEAMSPWIGKNSFKGVKSQQIYERGVKFFLTSWTKQMNHLYFIEYSIYS